MRLSSIRPSGPQKTNRLPILGLRGTLRLSNPGPDSSFLFRFHPEFLSYEQSTIRLR